MHKCAKPSKLHVQAALNSSYGNAFSNNVFQAPLATYSGCVYTCHKVCLELYVFISEENLIIVFYWSLS